MAIFLTDIEHGFEDIATVYDYHGNKWNRHRVTINYGSRPYIRIHGQRYYFDECIRGAYEF